MSQNAEKERAAFNACHVPAELSASCTYQLLAFFDTHVGWKHTQYLSVTHIIHCSVAKRWHCKQDRTSAWPTWLPSQLMAGSNFTCITPCRLPQELLLLLPYILYIQELQDETTQPMLLLDSV